MLRIINDKKIYSNISEKMNIPEEIVSSIGSFIFKDLRDKMINIEGARFYMLKLGTFKLRVTNSLKYLKFIEESRKKIKTNPTMSDEEKQEKLAYYDRIETNLSKTVDEYLKLIIEKKTFKQERDEQHNRNLQEQKANLGRPQEQNVQTGAR